MVKRVSDDRLTVSLAEGQKEQLSALAEANGVTLAFIVRYALTDFLSRRRGHQLRLDLFDPGATDG
jgi:predicted transcriptional regulator